MDTKTVTLSEAAAKKIAAIIAAEDGKKALRVAVEGGGCSGFSGCMSPGCLESAGYGSESCWKVPVSGARSSEGRMPP